MDDLVLRAATDLDEEVAGREQHGAAVGPVDLLLKEEVRSEAFRQRREDVPRGIGDREPCDRRLPVEVLHAQFHRDRGLHVEEHGHFTAEAEVLVPLSDVEADGGLALARFRGVDQRDGVLDLEAAEFRRERRRGVHLHL